MSPASMILSNKPLLIEIKTPFRAFQHLTANPSGLAAIIYLQIIHDSVYILFYKYILYNFVESGGVK